jgi:hypothetical protein
VTGIGTTESIATTGVHTFSFGLTAGSALVGTSTFFGYRDGSVSTGNVGTIGFSDNPPASGFMIRYFGSAGAAPSPNVSVGETFSSAGGTLGGVTYGTLQLARTYSLQATDAAVSAVPAPGTVSLMLGGAVMLLIGRRKRA